MREFAQILYWEGRRDALELRERSPDMTGTELIAGEKRIPRWRGEKDYSHWKPGWPVREGGQVWTLLQPHNAAHYPGIRPGDNRACWGLAHTTDPKTAKPWVAPFGTSGLYMAGECCSWEGRVWRNLYDSNPYPPLTQGGEARWEEAL